MGLDVMLVDENQGQLYSFFTKVDNCDHGEHGNKMCDSVFLFHKPDIPIQLEVVFIHGLEHGKCDDAYWKTWLARDEGPDNVWPMTWLKDDIPSAQIFALKYDGSTRQTSTNGRMDLYNLGEKLVQEMANFGGIGQNGVPVVFVCHGFGGLVAKQIVVSGMLHHKENGRVQQLLENISAFCFYSTPHNGSQLAKSLLYHDNNKDGRKGPLVNNFEAFNMETSRLNYQFHSVRRALWRFHNAAEAHETEEYKRMVVEEASSREMNASFMHLDENYTNMVKPTSKRDSSFRWLIGHLNEVLEGNVDCLPLSVERLSQECLVRSEEQEKHIKEVLRASRIVGLVGMGGSGKTTLAKVIFKSIFKDFEKGCYLDDVKSKGSRHEVTKMLLQQFGIIGDEVKILKPSHLCQLKAFVKEHKGLVVVDDLGSDEDFRHLLKDMDFSNAHVGSRMIVTCREWQVLKNHAPLVEKHDMVLLNETSQDVELFSYHAFNGARTEDERRLAMHIYLSKHAREENLMSDFLSVCKDIKEACNGLPLSLEVMGSCLGGFLKDKDTSARKCLEFWRGALAKLKNADSQVGSDENERLWSSLKPSIDALRDDVKEKYLDIACFFCGSVKYDEATLLQIWGNEDRDSFDLEILKDRSLIKVDKENGLVTMHHQLRDMGQRIVVDEGKKGVKYMSRVWKCEDVEKFLRTKIKKSKYLQGLSMSGWKKFKTEAMMIDCPRLRLLDLHDVEYGIIKTIDIKNPSSILWLCLIGSEITEVPLFVQYCEDLHVLDMRNCFFLEELHQFIGNLGNLSQLRLSFCWRLSSLPDSIGNLGNLSQLDLSGCQNLTSLPGSIGNLGKLSQLDLSDCSRLTSLPDSIGKLGNLSQLDLSLCWDLTSLPESIGNLGNLSQLNLSDCNKLTSLPDSVGNLGNLSQLDISYCKKLTSLPDSIGKLGNLSQLELSDCKKLTSLPDSIGKLGKLSQLDLIGCCELKSLPNSIGNLGNLSQLNLSGCSELTSLPDSICNLGNLSQLDLTGCCELTSLPDSIGNLGNLSQLKLCDCKKLTSLPDSIGNLGNLSQLDLFRCCELTSLPNSIGNLDNLSQLNLIGCRELTSLPNSIGNLGKLSQLRLRNCKKLTGLPYSIGNLGNLSQLDLIGCRKLTSLPDSIGNLGNLSQLDISYYKKLTSLPDSIGNLGNLSQLDISYCKKLTSLPDSIGNLGNLSQLDLTGCCNLTSLPDSIGKLGNLSQLELSDCKKLTSLPDSIGKLGKLSELDLSGCCELTSLPDSIGYLGNLSQLDLSYCKKLTSLPDSIGNLRNSCQLNLSRCWGLGNLPKLPKLELIPIES